MNFLFCSDPYKHDIPHPMWTQDVDAAYKCGNIYLLDELSFQKREWSKSVRKLILSDSQTTSLIYRGWMRDMEQYEQLYLSCLEKGFTLINSADSYKRCHYFESWYDLVKDYTPHSIMIEPYNIRNIMMAILSMNCKSVIIKDSVSSQKHHWETACFIKDAADVLNITSVISEFIRLQNNVDGIQNYIIAREYIPLKKIGAHPISGMPISQEFRSFVYQGKVITTDKYWEYGQYDNVFPPDQLVQDIAEKIYTATNNKFFTIDTALTEKNKWVCLEVGEGQVSSLPDNANYDKFYQKF